MPIQNTYLICTRGIDEDGSFTAEPGNTLFLKVPAGQDDYGQGLAMRRDEWREAVVAAADGEEDEITGSRGDILLFVHGYNNTTECVLWRTRTLQETLAAQGWKGLVIGFDWPSDNATLNYLEDRSDASAVALRLVQESLDLIVDNTDAAGAARGCKINIHLLGHSTGAYVIMEAFAQAQKVGGYFKAPWRIGQVAFIGGDVACDSLRADSEWSSAMFNRIMRLTNYSNGYDKVLGVSSAKRLGAKPRAGRVGLPDDIPRKAVNVDCSDYFLAKDPGSSHFTGTFNHSWHIGDPVFALDLALTLEGEIDRDYLPTRLRAGKGLNLVAGKGRPAYQSAWDLGASRGYRERK